MSGLTPEVARQIIPAHPSKLSTLELSAVLEAGALLESYILLARAEAEARIDAGNSVDGWEIVTTPGKRSIPDTVLAARQLAPLLEPHQILECATLGLGKVQDAIQEAEGCTAAEAKDILADYLKGNLVKGAGGQKLQMAPKEALELHPTTRAALRELAEVTNGQA